MKNVIVLFGVNGIGKSTIAEKLASKLGRAKILYGSQILSELFNNLSRKELEKQSSEEKKKALIKQFIKLFNLYNNQQIILDTHLLVPIRKNGGVDYENMWSNELNPYLQAICYIHAKPRDILMRRKIDTQRKRNLKLSNIHEDQFKNTSFLSTIEDICPTKIFENTQDNIEKTCSNILLFLNLC